MAITIQSRSFESLYDGLIALPENMTSEIYNGELHADPLPSDRHAFANSNLGTQIGMSCHFGNGGPGGWRKS